MPITILPQFETDRSEYLAEREDREAYERLNAPKTLVVRFGYLRMVGEFPWLSDIKPGCGSKIVVKTSRGTEIGEMLTSTCANSGCSKSVTRKEMLEYIENSGGRQYPFYTDGKALRLATQDDLIAQEALDESRHGLVKEARAAAASLGLPMKVVDAEPMLGGERLTYYYTSEDRVDFRALVQELRADHHERVEMRQVGARDEARLTADYERCGQYCCCKNFLKVLKPISMRSAKIQKATLDPLKISGRCGRLMCCLRYEDQTYEELRKNLPHRKSHVGTPEGDGIVIDSQILTQLVLVELDDTRKRVAIPIEDLAKPGEGRRPEPPPTEPSGIEPIFGDRPDSGSPERPDRTGDEPGKKKRRRRRKKAGATGEAKRGAEAASPLDSPLGSSADTESRPGEASDTPNKKKRRRRRKKPTGSGSSPDQAQPSAQESSAPGSAPSGASSSGSEQSSPSKKKRRRRRKKPSSGGGSGESSGGNNSGPSTSD